MSDVATLGGGWGYIIPLEMAEAWRYVQEHPLRPLSDDIFRPHRDGCPSCRCANHCRCFDAVEGVPEGETIHVRFTASAPAYRIQMRNGRWSHLVGRRRHGRVVLVAVRHRASKGWRRYVRRRKAGE